MSQDDDELGPVSEEERREANALRKALEAGDPAPGSDAAFAAAVRASMVGARPELAAEARTAVVADAIREGSRRARRRSLRTMLAIAAAVVLGLAVPAALYQGGSSTPSITYGGPTDAVFEGPFVDAQRASERMDLIVDARTEDYFAALRGEQP